MFYKDYEKIIGLGSGVQIHHQRLYMHPKAEKYLVEESGIITKKGKSVIFDDGFTARLLMGKNLISKVITAKVYAGYLKHSHNKKRSIFVQYMLIDMMLSRLSAKSIEEAETKYGHLKVKLRMLLLLKEDFGNGSDVICNL